MVKGATEEIIYRGLGRVKKTDKGWWRPRTNPREQHHLTQAYQVRQDAVARTQVRGGGCHFSGAVVFGRKSQHCQVHLAERDWGISS